VCRRIGGEITDRLQGWFGAQGLCSGIAARDLFIWKQRERFGEGVHLEVVLVVG